MEGMDELVELMRKEWLQNRAASHCLRAGAVPFISVRKLLWSNPDETAQPAGVIPQALERRVQTAVARRAAGRRVEDFPPVMLAEVGAPARQAGEVTLEPESAGQVWSVVRSSRAGVAPEDSVAKLASKIAAKRWQ